MDLSMNFEYLIRKMESEIRVLVSFNGLYHFYVISVNILSNGVAFCYIRYCYRCHYFSKEISIFDWNNWNELDSTV